jgi:hypothetical protein
VLTRSTTVPVPVLALLLLCRAVESQDYAGAVEAYTAALAVDPRHKHVNKELQLGLCRVEQQLGRAEEAVQVSGVEAQVGRMLLFCRLVACAILRSRGWSSEADVRSFSRGPSDQCSA